MHTFLWAHSPSESQVRAHDLIANYCFDCHDDEIKKGGLDLYDVLKQKHFDAELMFENIITEKMPLKKEKAT